jgi:hypothetical protein
MKFVIQCAAKKDSSAGCMITREGKRVLFVANPRLAPTTNAHIYATPNDDSGDGRNWRERVLAYNSDSEGNPLRLLPAYRLYTNAAYRALADGVGVNNLYILSAAWGLIPAAFLTPNYDVTFQHQPPETRYKRRTRRDPYQDLRLLRRSLVVLRREGLPGALLRADQRLQGAPNRLLQSGKTAGIGGRRICALRNRYTDQLAL